MGYAHNLKKETQCLLAILRSDVGKSKVSSSKTGTNRRPQNLRMNSSGVFGRLRGRRTFSLNVTIGKVTGKSVKQGNLKSKTISMGDVLTSPLGIDIGTILHKYQFREKYFRLLKIHRLTRKDVRMKVRENCLLEYARTHPTFASNALVLVRRCYRLCPHYTETVLREHFEEVTKEVVMYLMLLWVNTPGLSGEKVEALLLAEFGQVCHD